MKSTYQKLGYWSVIILLIPNNLYVIICDKLYLEESFIEHNKSIFLPG